MRGGRAGAGLIDILSPEFCPEFPSRVPVIMFIFAPFINSQLQPIRKYVPVFGAWEEPWSWIWKLSGEYWVRPLLSGRFVMAEQGTFRTTRNCRSGKRDVIVDRSAKRPRRPVVYRVSFKEAEVDASPVLQVHAFGVPANPKKFLITS